MLLLLLGIALLLGATVQAVRTARGQQRTNERVLESYARLAAWNFEQQALPAVQHHVTEPLFHPLHLDSYADGRTAPASIHSLVEDRESECAMCPAPWRAARFGVRFHTVAGTIETSRSLAPAVVQRVVDKVRAHRARARPERGPLHGRAQDMIVDQIQDSAALIMYYSKPVPADTLVYAIVLRPDVLGRAFGHVFASGALLPEPLVEGVETSAMLTQSVLTPEGGRIYGSDMAAGHVGERRLSGLGNLVVRVHILEGAERHLIPGSAAMLSWPILLGLLVLAIGLLVAVFSQMRREHALAQLRSDFVSSVSHELRTPLSLQRIFLDTLRLDRATTAAQRAWCFDNIDRESMRLSHLVENVLLFSRSERGALTMGQPQNTRLAPLIADTLRTFAPLAAAASAHLESDLDEDVAAPVDPGAMRQMMINILENAVKYGPRGQRIDVALTLDGTTARVVVDDQGSGVPRAERQTIFRPYARGAVTRNSAVAGSGIGLAVVDELVRAHGGSVRVEDAPAGGARFVVELPGAWRDDTWDSAAVAAEPAESERPSYGEAV